MSFFSAPDPTDKNYSALQDPKNSWVVEARANVERLWSFAHAYMDPVAPQRASSHFHPEFWELYLAASLLEFGIDLVSAAERPCRVPDFAIRDPRVWVEAIAPGPGRGPNRVEESELGLVRPVPDEPIMLRLTHAIFQKCEKHKNYVDRGLVAESNPYVIALNAARIPSASKERMVPRIVRALFGIGPEIVLIDRHSGAIRQGGHGSKPLATKGSGHSVPMTFFLDERSSAVSAIIYSCVDAFNCPQHPGDDMLIVHNPKARNKIGPNLIPCPYECVFDDNVVRVAERRGGTTGLQ